MTIYGYEKFGFVGDVFNVMVDIRRGIPAVDILGLADRDAKGSRELVRAAIKNSGLDFPPGRMVIVLSPAEIHKEGEECNLPIALGILNEAAMAKGGRPLPNTRTLCLGTLGTDGTIKPARGTYAALYEAMAKGICDAIIPEGTPASDIPDGIRTYKVRNLREAIEAFPLIGTGTATNAGHPWDRVEFPSEPDDEAMTSWNTIPNSIRRAMVIAAAGRHHLLVIGRPGCGKTSALRQFPALLPALTAEEACAVARIRSLAGLPAASRDAPFRMPHQTASMEGMCGGGASLRPGEISLAHNGVLFLDDAAEFKASVLQMLRIPLDTGEIRISRAGRTSTYPANFQLVMAETPCPCGFYGSKKGSCLCSEHTIRQYWNKITAPLDHIGIRAGFNDLNEGRPLTLTEARRMISGAVSAQRNRGTYNQQVPAEHIGDSCGMTEWAEKEFYRATTGSNSINFRLALNIRRVARTIADLDASELIGLPHVKEAVKLAEWHPLPQEWR